MSEPYFVATRMLAYQLLHAEKTRTRQALPFLVAVLPDFAQEKYDRLTQDGATVIQVGPIEKDWVVPGVDRWRHVLAKLRLWEQIQYDKICFLDADTILTAPLDAIFAEPETRVLSSLQKAKKVKSDEAPLPRTYGMAGITQTWVEHEFPPVYEDFENPGEMNAGFFVFKPSLEMFQYYMSLFELPGRFAPGLIEQNLLNYAHRPEGNMPWVRLKTHWNVMLPTLQDYQGGAITMHDKWWAPYNAEVGDIFLSIKRQMEGYYEQADALNRVRGMIDTKT